MPDLGLDWLAGGSEYLLRKVQVREDPPGRVSFSRGRRREAAAWHTTLIRVCSALQHCNGLGTQTRAQKRREEARWVPTRAGMVMRPRGRVVHTSVQSDQVRARRAGYGTLARRGVARGGVVKRVSRCSRPITDDLRHMNFARRESTPSLARCAACRSVPPSAETQIRPNTSPSPPWCPPRAYLP